MFIIQVSMALLPKTCEEYVVLLGAIKSDCLHALTLTAMGWHRNKTKKPHKEGTSMRSVHNTFRMLQKYITPCNAPDCEVAFLHVEDMCMHSIH